MKNFKFAFTLAEVLITLGIIGVVAAMTIPTLIANTQGKQFSSAFKKSISTLNQMVRLNKANYGFDFSDAHGEYAATVLYNEPCDKTSNPESDHSICGMVNANLTGANRQSNDFAQLCQNATRLNSEGEYCIKGNSSGDGFMLDMVDTNKYMLADGSVIMFPAYLGDGSPCHLPRSGDMLDNSIFFLQCSGYIDVNGANLPNEIVTCTTGTTSYDLNEPCTVDNNKVKDVFPVLFYDSTVVPATNAAAYVLNTAK